MYQQQAWLSDQLEIAMDAIDDASIDGACCKSVNLTRVNIFESNIVQIVRLDQNGAFTQARQRMHDGAGLLLSMFSSHCEE